MVGIPSAANRRKLDKLADDWVENAVRDLAFGAEIGDWKADSGVVLDADENGYDAAYSYLMDRFSEWSTLVGTIVRTRRRSS